jgi:hypothetical protein
VVAKKATAEVRVQALMILLKAKNLVTVQQVLKNYIIITDHYRPVMRKNLKRRRRTRRNLKSRRKKYIKSE